VTREPSNGALLIVACLLLIAWELTEIGEQLNTLIEVTR
jgi:hypothetical protein